MTAPLTLLRHREALRAYHEASTRSQLEAVEREWAETRRDLRATESSKETLAQYLAGEVRDLITEFRSFGWREWAQVGACVAVGGMTYIIARVMA